MAEYEVVYMDIDDVIPYENNPRRNEKAVDAVANSIQKFGFRNPIIIDNENVIICGHTRRLAAIKLGLKKVPCCVATDLTDEQIIAFRLADNRVAAFSTWDEAKLKEEIAEILDIEMTDFGFREKLVDDVAREMSSVTYHRCPKCGHEWA